MVVFQECLQQEERWRWHLLCTTSDGWNRKAVSSEKKSCLERRWTTVEGPFGDFPSSIGGGQYMSAVSKCVRRSAHPSRCFVKKGFSDPISSENTPPIFPFG